MMKPLILLVGPHAIGKTTAACRWLAKYSNLTVVHCDNCLVVTRDSEEKQRGWQGSTAEKWSRLAETRMLDGVVVLESCASYGTQLVRGLNQQDLVLHTYCRPQQLVENLKYRCDKAGKKFNAPYWDLKRATYECRTRMSNSLKTHLLPTQYQEFEVNSHQDWIRVDEAFGQLYRRLNRESLRDR